MSVLKSLVHDLYTAAYLTLDWSWVITIEVLHDALCVLETIR